MIRVLGELDRDLLLAYIKVAPSLNIFILGDVEKFGFGESFQELWGFFNGEGSINGVLLRYRNNFVVYSADLTLDMKGFVEIIKGYDGNKRISGQAALLDRIEPMVAGYTRKDYYFCELKALPTGPVVDKLEVLVAVEADAERLYEFIEGIDEFSGFGNNPESYRRKIACGAGRAYYAEDDCGEMVSVVQTTAENSLSAMIVGVATKLSARGQGLMSTCLSKLCTDIINEGKSLCLFYNNPSAGSVYLKMGFKTIDDWSMLTFKQEDINTSQN